MNLQLPPGMKLVLLFFLSFMEGTNTSSKYFFSVNRRTLVNIRYNLKFSLSWFPLYSLICIAFNNMVDYPLLAVTSEAGTRVVYQYTLYFCIIIRC